MPRIFKYGDIPHISFTPDKEINILMWRSPSYLIIYKSHTLLKMVWFFWPMLYNTYEGTLYLTDSPKQNASGGQWSAEA